jgi:cysteine desulfurase
MIYLDYAAATPVDPIILEQYINDLTNTWANPSAPHSPGRSAKAILDTSRQSISDVLECSPQEIYFCNSATEVNNIIFNTYLNTGLHIITSSIEHASISSIAHRPQFAQYITQVDSLPTGQIDIEQLFSPITDSTALISLHLSHNEHGVIQPIQAIAARIKHLNQTRSVPIRLHVDASQSPQYLDIRPDHLGADYLTISSHKIYAPRGSALLYAKKKSPLTPLILGGGQESGIHSGTENIAGIHALSTALAQCTSTRQMYVSTTGQLRDYLAQSLQEQIPIKINGVFEAGNYSTRIANNLNFTLPNCNQESALVLYDQNAICISAGSSCSSGSNQISQSILKTNPIPGAHIRVSLGHPTTQVEIEQFVSVTKRIFDQLSRN